MGYKGRMTGHGFRGVASTILHESGCYKSEHIEVQLAHLTFNKVAKAYNYAEYLEPRTKMMQDWADFLERTLRTEGWSELEAAVLRAADELHSDACIADETWAGLAAHLDERQLIEVPMLVGQYHIVSFKLNTLGIQREPGLGGFND